MARETPISVHVCECQICKSGTDVKAIQRHRHINLFLSRLTEPQRRWYVATLSESADSPGDRQLALITGLDEKTMALWDFAWSGHIWGWSDQAKQRYPSISR